ncbi:MAG TPA: trypsin-like peptidase domain-containing protein [Ktedonobacterales bacterium]
MPDTGNSLLDESPSGLDVGAPTEPHQPYAPPAARPPYTAYPPAPASSPGEERVPGLTVYSYPQGANASDANSSSAGQYGSTPSGTGTYGPGAYGPGSPPYAPAGSGFERGADRRGRRGAGILALVVALALAAGVGGGVLGAHLAAPNQTNTPGRTVTTSLAPGGATALSPAVGDLQQSVETVIQNVQPSVVEVTSTSTGQGQEAIGSGDILTKDGYIVTNDHVVQGFDTFSVTLSSGKTLPAHVVGEDAQDDLAVLKVSATNLKPITFGDSAKVQTGEFVVALGNPLGLNQSATFGIVSALNRTASEAPNGPAGELTGLIQTSAPINPGNSGGALVDLQGQLIGIPTLGATNAETGGGADGIGFAIPSDRVQYVVNQVIQHGQLVSSGQGFLGIVGEDVNPSLAAANGLSAQSGVLITGFANDAAGASPARQAGLQTGDIITAVNGQTVTNSEDLASALLTQSPGTQVALTIERGSQRQTVHATLGERPANSQG